MSAKLIGGTLLIIACTGYGFSKGQEYRRHVEELAELQRIALMFAAETIYSKLPIAELASRIAIKVKQPYKEWLTDLSDSLKSSTQQTMRTIWEDKAEKILQELLLTEEEAEELRNLGMQIENYNIQMQENAFRWYASRLEVRKNELEKKVSEKQRLSNSLGILSGIFLTILLI